MRVRVCERIWMYVCPYELSFYLVFQALRTRMVLSKLLGKSNNQGSLQEVESKIEEKDSNIQEIRGEQQLQDLKKQKRQELRKKKKELKKKEFEQTKAGKLLGNIGDSLDSLSNNIDGSSPEERQTKKTLNNISNQIELLDGDGKQDNSRAVDFFGTREKPSSDKVLGTVEVEGSLDIEDDKMESGNRKSKDPFDVNTDIDMSF